VSDATPTSVLDLPHHDEERAAVYLHDLLDMLAIDTRGRTRAAIFRDLYESVHLLKHGPPPERLAQDRLAVVLPFRSPSDENTPSP
jgi:hypothetical protein